MAFTYLLHEDSEIRKNAGSIAVTSSSADANYPALNASDLPVALPWRSTGDTSEWWQVDLSAPKTVDLIAVCGLNLSSSFTQLQFKSGDTDPPTTATHILPAPRRGTSWLKLGASVTHRYWRLELADASNPNGFLDVGYVLLGVKTEWSHGFGPRFIENHLVLNRRTENRFGTDFSGEKLVDVVVVNFDFGGDGALNQAEENELRPFLEKLNGAQKPLFIVPEGEDAASSGYLSRLEAPDGWTIERLRRPFRRYSEIGFKEENRGLPLIG